MLTGRYQNRFRVGQEEPLGFNQPEIGMDPGVPTMPRYLQQLGYRTVLVGKWHLGDPPRFGPLKSGYDRFFGIHGGGKDYFQTPKGAGVSGSLYDGEKPVGEHRYLTDELGDRAVSEITAAARDKVPLFLSLHFTAPHWPWEGPEDLAVAQNLKNIFHYDGGSIATFQKMLTSLDENVAKVLAALKRLGLEKDTLVVFTSDNGGERFSNTWPLSGMKTELLEGGIRVPVLVRWPRHIRKGSVSEQVAISMDWMPTFLRPPVRLQGSTRPATESTSCPRSAARRRFRVSCSGCSRPTTRPRSAKATGNIWRWAGTNTCSTWPRTSASAPTAPAPSQSGSTG